MKILLIEDNQDLAELTALALRGEGYAVDVAHSGEEGRMLAFVHEYDGILLDLGLGDRSGLEVLHELRARERMTPVLVLTSDTSSETIVRALDGGADDYVVKGGPEVELLARVRALLRRGPSDRSGEVLTVGNLVVNRLTQRVLVGGEPLKLTALELRLLQELATRPGTVFSRAALVEKVWDRLREPDSNIVDVYIGRLRRKLADAGSTPHIETVRGAGYALRI